MKGSGSMRSTIFSDYASLPKEFLDDFGVLWSIPDEVRDKLIPHLLEFAKTEKWDDSRAAMEKAAADLKTDVPSVLKALRLLYYIYHEWSPYSDSPEAFLADLEELDLFPVEKKAVAERFFTAFPGAVKCGNARRASKTTATSLLPTLRSASCLVDFRAVIEKPFGTVRDDRIESYEPRSVGLVPVFLVKIRLEDAHEQPCVFQCEESGIKLLMDALQAALKDLAAAKKTLPRNPSSGEA